MNIYINKKKYKKKNRSVSFSKGSNHGRVDLAAQTASCVKHEPVLRLA